MFNPKISIIICTYNGEKYLERCLDSVLSQNCKDFEIICVDGLSSDNTLEIINSYKKKDKRIKLIINKNRLPEGKNNGKWLGYINSKGEILGFIDQDNILQNNEVFNSVLNLINRKKCLGVLGGLKSDINDNLIVRYVSLFGTDSFLAYRSVDFLINFKIFDNNYLNIKMKEDDLWLTGGNCFFFKRTNLSKIGGYSQDITVVNNLVKNGLNNLAIIKDCTKHYAERNLMGLVRKKFKWGSNYFLKRDKKFDYMPRTLNEKISFIKNLIFNIFIFPNLFYSYIIYNRKRDFVAFLFPLMALFNTFAYGLNFIKDFSRISFRK